ncbi:MAG: hypothetical protein Q7R96_01060 [Nanoarchaeota archaeon]|nr:hypothetical protein [Nanoarchaeota archaeon]
MKPRIIYYSCLLSLSFYLLIISAGLLKGDGHYIFDTTIFIFITLFFYHTYEKRQIKPYHYILLNTIMIMHSLGRFGAFNWTIWLFHWDVITHIAASFVITLFFNHFLRNANLSTTNKYLLLIIISLGIATIGELTEFAGAVTTPNGQGILGVESRGSPIPWLSPDYWDTMKDLVMNGVGTLLSLASIIIIEHKKNKQKFI